MWVSATRCGPDRRGSWVTGVGADKGGGPAERPAPRPARGLAGGTAPTVSPDRVPQHPGAPFMLINGPSSLAHLVANSGPRERTAGWLTGAGRTPSREARAGPPIPDALARDPGSGKQRSGEGTDAALSAALMAVAGPPPPVVPVSGSAVRGCPAHRAPDHPVFPLDCSWGSQQSKN